MLASEKIEDLKAVMRKEYLDLYISAFTDLKARSEFKKIMQNTDEGRTLNEKQLECAVSEMVGLGFIEELLNTYDNITDLVYNGDKLVIETRNRFIKYDKEVTNAEIEKISAKFANSINKDFSYKFPILDASFGNLRVNSVHHSNSSHNSTMAIRVINPSIVLENDFSIAPHDILVFLKKIVKNRKNIMITGAVGTGKTELQKLLMTYILSTDKVCLIQDVYENHIKDLKPDMDIISWLTSATISHSDLINAGLRNNPVWIINSELRGSEAYDVYDAVLTGHSTMPTFHSISAEASPKRFLQLAKKSGKVVDDNEFLTDIYTYFDYVIHLSKYVSEEGKVIRYIDEIVQLTSNKKTVPIYKHERSGVNEI